MRSDDGRADYGGQAALFSSLSSLELARWLLADLHDDLAGKIARSHQLADLSTALGSGGTLLPGGEIAFAAWTEARTSFIHGNYMATVLLCQCLAEHVLAAHLLLGLEEEELPARISFQATLKRCLARGMLSTTQADELRRLMELRNPLSHFRSINDPSNLTRRIIDTQQRAEHHLLSDATFALTVAIGLLSLPEFRLGT